MNGRGVFLHCYPMDSIGVIDFLMMRENRV